MVGSQKTVLENADFTDSQIEALASVFVVKDVECIDFWDTVKYFTRDEFKCKCGGRYCNGYPVEPDKNLVTLLDLIREDAGVPCIISSGTRCETHNANVGGVWNSWHKKGKAADFTLRGKAAAQIIRYAQKYSDRIEEIYAIDNSYVHIAVK